MLDAFSSFQQAVATSELHPPQWVGGERLHQATLRFVSAERVMLRVNLPETWGVYPGQILQWWRDALYQQLQREVYKHPELACYARVVSCEVTETHAVYTLQLLYGTATLGALVLQSIPPWLYLQLRHQFSDSPSPLMWWLADTPRQTLGYDTQTLPLVPFLWSPGLHYLALPALERPDAHHPRYTSWHTSHAPQWTFGLFLERLKQAPPDIPAQVLLDLAHDGPKKYHTYSQTHYLLGQPGGHFFVPWLRGERLPPDWLSDDPRTCFLGHIPPVSQEASVLTDPKKELRPLRTLETYHLGLEGNTPHHVSLQLDMLTAWIRQACLSLPAGSVVMVVVSGWDALLHTLGIHHDSVLPSGLHTYERIQGLVASWQQLARQEKITLVMVSLTPDTPASFSSDSPLYTQEGWTRWFDQGVILTHKQEVVYWSQLQEQYFLSWSLHQPDIALVPPKLTPTSTSCVSQTSLPQDEPPVMKEALRLEETHEDTFQAVLEAPVFYDDSQNVTTVVSQEGMDDLEGVSLDHQSEYVTSMSEGQGIAIHHLESHPPFASLEDTPEIPHEDTFEGHLYHEPLEEPLEAFGVEDALNTTQHTDEGLQSVTMVDEVSAVTLEAFQQRASAVEVETLFEEVPQDNILDEVPPPIVPSYTQVMPPWCFPMLPLAWQWTVWYGFRHQAGLPVPSLEEMFAMLALAEQRRMQLGTHQTAEGSSFSVSSPVMDAVSHPESLPRADEPLFEPDPLFQLFDPEPLLPETFVPSHGLSTSSDLSPPPVSEVFDESVPPSTVLVAEELQGQASVVAIPEVTSVLAEALDDISVIEDPFSFIEEDASVISSASVSQQTPPLTPQLEGNASVPAVVSSSPQVWHPQYGQGVCLKVIELPERTVYRVAFPDPIGIRLLDAATVGLKVQY